MRRATAGGLAALALVSVTPGRVGAAGPGVPVHVGGDSETDACATLGTVVGLDPKGDNFLSVRSGPGGRPFREVARIHTGQRVTICEERGPWLGIVYPEQGDARDCGVSTPRARAAAYAGPCRSGWVHRRYIRLLAG